MQKAATMLALVGGLIAAGIALSFYGSMIITEDLTQAVENIGQGGTLEISAELDPSVNSEGVYVVQVMEFTEGMISVSLVDPLGSQIVSKVVETESLEEQFEITNSGTYTMTIENAGENTDVVGVLGHVPDTAKFSVGVSGFYLLVVGLIGMGIVGIFVVKNRKRN